MNVCDHLRPPISLNWIVYRRFLFLSLTSYNLLITYKLFHICGFRYIVLKREAIYFRLLLFVIYIFSLPRGNIPARIRVSRRELTKFHAIKLTSIRILIYSRNFCIPSFVSWETFTHYINIMNIISLILNTSYFNTSISLRTRKRSFYLFYWNLSEQTDLIQTTMKQLTYEISS